MSLNIKEHVALAALTTFEIGGVARYFVEVSTEDEVSKAVRWAKEKNIPFIMLAGGSNVLVPDTGLEALVVKVKSNEWKAQGELLEADAGCSLLALIRAAGENGLGGWEKLAGIPGTIGGAVRGNAGAFGSEIKDFVERVRALNTESGEIKDFTNTESDFSYRHSYFKDHPEWIITRITLALHPVQYDISYQLTNETILERERRHLQNVRAAGSFFMNPIAPPNVIEMFEKEKQMKSRGGRVPAGWLIEKAGMKGIQVGDAQASLQHPNYIVNNGNATALQVRELAEKIKSAVEEKFGVRLEEEAVVF